MKAINEIKYLSQRDPKWSDVKLGSSNITVGRYGCTSVCLSMLSDYFDCFQDPKQIATNLRNYSGDGNINWIGLNFPSFSFRWREGNLFSNKQNLDMEMIKSYIKHPDRAALLEVADHSHWVLALWETYDKDILAIDPWNGRTCEVFKDYKNITGASLFVKWTDKTKKAWQGKGQPVAPKYN